MTRTPFPTLIDQLERDRAGRINAHIPDDWMQGRTTYGGLTAALCLEAALEVAGDVPLRSAQVAFVGPVGGDVMISPTVLRAGKSSVFVSVDLVGEAGCAARCIFTFGKRRESHLDFADLPMPPVEPASELPAYFPENVDVGPKFARNFEMKLMEGDRPMTGASTTAVGLWLRHRGGAVAASPTALLALGDAPPPAALSMFSQPGPISSMTWMAEFLAEDLSTTDGWYYARHVAETARNGYSSQDMKLWSAGGKPLMAGRQTIAVFA